MFRINKVFQFSSLRSATYQQSLPYLEKAKFNPQNQTVALMLNLGGPNNKEEITPFLTRFFADSTVIRIPFGLGPYIAKLRGPVKINKQYAAIGGYSPLLNWTLKQGQGMTNNLENVGFLPAFRYGLPLQEDAIEYAFDATEGKVQEFVLFSQYPQYSCSTAGNAIRNAASVLLKYKETYKSDFKITIIDQWHTNELYIEALSKIIEDEITKNNFQQQLDETIVVFSAHSIPADFMWEGDQYLYYIYESCRLVQENLKRKGLGLHFNLAFQSKVGFQKWAQPSTKKALETLLKNSKYRNIIVSPMGFTSDHLETLYEIDIELFDQFKPLAEKFNKKLLRASSLNDHPLFIKSLNSILSEGMKLKSKGHRLRCHDCKFEECNVVNTLS